MNYIRNEDQLSNSNTYYVNKGMHVEVVTDLADEPITVQQAKDYMHIDADDEDAEILAMITTARQTLERYAGVSMGEKELLLTMDEYADRVELPYGPVASVDSVEVDGDAVSVDDGYELRAGKHLTMLTGYRNLSVAYTTKATYPAAWKNAVKAQVAFMYEHRGDEKGLELSDMAKAIMASYVKLNVF